MVPPKPERHPRKNQKKPAHPTVQQLSQASRALRLRSDGPPPPSSESHSIQQCLVGLLPTTQPPRSAKLQLYRPDHRPPLPNTPHQHLQQPIPDHPQPPTCKPLNPNTLKPENPNTKTPQNQLPATAKKNQNHPPSQSPETKKH